MKKISIVFVASALIGLAVTGCKKEKAVSCEAAIQRVVNASTAWQSEQSVANCNSYKSALQDLINSSCFSSLSQEQKSGYQENLSGLDCEPK
ncbi:MAG: hypothetical protein H3C48_07270 [Chitinophagaceae bacterium]|nr:hypothetical protein [Chitinophagaceae bacterium]